MFTRKFYNTSEKYPTFNTYYLVQMIIIMESKLAYTISI